MYILITLKALLIYDYLKSRTTDHVFMFESFSKLILIFLRLVSVTL